MHLYILRPQSGSRIRWYEKAIAGRLKQVGKKCGFKGIIQTGVTGGLKVCNDLEGKNRFICPLSGS